MTTVTTPNPGSDEALAKGCTCPVIDNGRGHGRGDGNFWINEGCPLHTPKSCVPVVDDIRECESCK